MKRLLFIFILLFALVGFGYAATQQTSSTTAATLIDRAEVYLNDDENRFWSAGELLTWLNDGMIDIVSRTNCLEATEDISLQENTLEYSVTSTYTTVKAVHYIDEKVVNGTMETNGNWTAINGASPHEQSTDQKNAGTYSWKLTTDAADEGTKSDTFQTTNGFTYYYKVWVYPSVNTDINIYIVGGDGSTELVDTDVTGLTAAAFNLVAGSFKETTTGSSAYFAVRSTTANGSDTYYIDDASLNSKAKALRKRTPNHVGISEYSSEPLYWYDWAGSIGVFPQLDTRAAEKITVYYITRPTAIASTASITTPALYDTALVYYVVAQAWMKENKMSRYIQVMALYEAELRRIRLDMNEFIPKNLDEQTNYSQ